MSHPRIPDSALARQATQYVNELLSPSLYRHTVRTFLLGDAAGQRQGLRYDVELLYLASVLHDLGLAGNLNSPDRFEVAGAHAAKEFVTRHGLSADKAGILWDAIALHTSLGIAIHKQPEVALVAIGAAIDVVGLGVDQLDPTVIDQILSEYPRTGFEDDLLNAVTEVVRSNPMSAAFTWMADVGRSQIPGFTCPSFLDALRGNPLRTSIEPHN